MSGEASASSSNCNAILIDASACTRRASCDSECLFNAMPPHLARLRSRMLMPRRGEMEQQWRRKPLCGRPAQHQARLSGQLGQSYWLLLVQGGHTPAVLRCGRHSGEITTVNTACADDASRVRWRSLDVFSLATRVAAGGPPAKQDPLLAAWPPLLIPGERETLPRTGSGLVHCTIIGTRSPAESVTANSDL